MSEFAPDSFWNVYVHGTIFQVDNDTAITMRADINSQAPSASIVPVLVEYQDIYGARIFIDICGISSLWQNTPEWRERSHAHDRQLKRERHEHEGFDE